MLKLIQTALCVLVLAFAVNLPVNLVRQHRWDQELEGSGRPALATVVGEERCVSKAGRYRCVHVEFDAAGERVDGWLADKALRAGQTLPILYAPSHPARWRRADVPPSSAGESPLGPRLALASGLGLIFGLASLGVLRELWSSGRS